MDDKTPPENIDELDALTWENLQLKAELARRDYQAFIDGYNAKVAAFGKKYDFDPATTRVDLVTRKITRQ